MGFCDSCEIRDFNESWMVMIKQKIVLKLWLRLVSMQGNVVLLLRLHQFQLIYAHIGGEHPVIDHGLAFFERVDTAHCLPIH